MRTGENLEGAAPVLPEGPSRPVLRPSADPFGVRCCQGRSSTQLALRPLRRSVAAGLRVRARGPEGQGVGGIAGQSDGPSAVYLASASILLNFRLVEVQALTSW